MLVAFNSCNVLAYNNRLLGVILVIGRSQAQESPTPNNRSLDVETSQELP